MNRGCGCSGGCECSGGVSGGCGCGISGGCESSDSMLLQIVIILLLMYLIYHYGMENYVGNGLGTPAGIVGAFTSGATLRRLGQQFSSTDQGVSMTLYNADLPSADKAVQVVVYLK